MRHFIIFLCLFVEFSLQEISLCSSQNTGASGDSTYDQYQSNGSCELTCEGYAYAILLDSYCWCSNYAPSSTESVSQCQDDCPGYPSDKCGNTEENYYAYVLIGNPSGTASASASATTSNDRSSIIASSTITDGSSQQAATSSSSSTSATTTDNTSSSSSSSSSSRSTTTSASSTSDSSPVTSFIIKTITGGAATTIITTQVAESSSSSGNNADSNNSKNNNSHKTFFDYPGKVAGVFVVVGLIVVLLILLLLWFCCIRNRHRNNDGDAGLKKDESDVSSTENDLEKLFNNQVVVDQRLDPNSMFLNLNNSKKSLGDEIDYSRRVLRVVNQ